MKRNKNVFQQFKYAAAVLLGMFFPGTAGFAQNAGILVEPLFGCQYGTLYEYVFANYGTNKSYRKLSQLDWEMKPIFYAGGKADILYKLFDFSFYGGGFFSTKCGETSDSDWLSDSDKDMKTNYSISNNSLKRGGFCGTSFSASFPVLSWLEVSPSVSVDYEYYYFSARDGYGYYGDSQHSKSNTDVSWTDQNAKFYPTGTLAGIDYKRNQFFIWTGILSRFKPFNFLELSAGIYTSPFSIVDSVDHHFNLTNGKLTNGTFYYDSMYGFFGGWKIDSSVSYLINRHLSVKAAASWTLLNCIKGCTYKNTSSESGPYAKVSKSYSESGAGGEWWNWTISVIYRPVKAKQNNGRHHTPFYE